MSLERVVDEYSVLSATQRIERVAIEHDVQVLPTDIAIEAFGSNVDVDVPRPLASPEHHAPLRHVVLEVPSLDLGEGSRLHDGDKQSFFEGSLPCLTRCNRPLWLALFTNK